MKAAFEQLNELYMGLRAKLMDCNPEMAEIIERGYWQQQSEEVDFDSLIGVTDANDEIEVMITATLDLIEVEKGNDKCPLYTREIIEREPIHGQQVTPDREVYRTVKDEDLRKEIGQKLRDSKSSGSPHPALDFLLVKMGDFDFVTASVVYDAYRSEEHALSGRETALARSQIRNWAIQ